MDPNVAAAKRSLTPLGWACMALSALSILVMVTITSIEVFTRATLGLSFQLSNELGGYLLVALTFFSFAVCQERDSFIQVDLFQARFSPEVRNVLRVVFGVVMIGFCLILEWYFIRMLMRSYASGSVSATLLRIPVWIPQSSMVLGMGAFILALIRSLVIDIRTTTRRTS